jgi:hypothetical protein
MAERTDDKSAERPIVTERVVTREVKEPPLGPNASTEPEDPAEHFYLASDGETKINAFGEPLDSKEAKQRLAARGLK